MDQTPTTGSERAPAFYRACSGSLSQGDIFRQIPWGVVEAPLAICRPQGRPQHAVFNPLASLPNAFKKREFETIHAQAGLSHGIALWHDCEIDKAKNQGRAPDKWFVAIAPIHPLGRFQPDQWEKVRRGERRPFFHLPAHPELDLSESFVDLRHVWSVRQSLLDGADRFTSLTPDARDALHAHLFTFFTHRRLSTSAACPACGGNLNPEDLLTDDGEAPE